jgi:hypothetical protein
VCSAFLEPVRRLNDDGGFIFKRYRYSKRTTESTRKDTIDIHLNFPCKENDRCTLCESMNPTPGSKDSTYVRVKRKDTYTGGIGA